MRIIGAVLGIVGLVVVYLVTSAETPGGPTAAQAVEKTQPRPTPQQGEEGDLAKTSSPATEQSEEDCPPVDDRLAGATLPDDVDASDAFEVMNTGVSTAPKQAPQRVASTPAPAPAPAPPPPAPAQRKVVNEVRGNSVIQVSYVKVDGEWRRDGVRLPDIDAPPSKDDPRPAASGKPIKPGRVHDLTQTNFSREVLRSSGTVAVFFHATWCGACKTLMPSVRGLASEFSTIKMGQIDIDGNRDLAKRYKIQSVPTVIMFKNGKPESRLVGPQVEELRTSLRGSAP
jgi:thioredoxin 1